MRLAHFAIACTAVLSLACAGVRVQTDYDQAVDFAQLKSFAWLDPPLREDASAGQGEDPFTHNTLVDKRVREEVEAWLVAHGYRPAKEEELPDFVLRYELEIRDVDGSSPVSVGFGTGYGSGGGGGYGAVGTGVGYSPTSNRQEGTLIVDVIDPESHQVEWRGWGTSSVRNNQVAPQRVKEMVAAILERFPPKPRAGS